MDLHKQSSFSRAIFLLMGWLLFSGLSFAQSSQIIPQPNAISWGEGRLWLSKKIKIVRSDFDSQAELLFQFVKQLPVAKVIVPQVNVSLLKNAELPAEAYRLQVDESAIRIEAGSDAGAFYAIQSLMQLADRKGRVRFVSIEDAPRFPYRGLHLDCSRHFMKIDSIYRLIDEMARYKLNTFHWHLVDGGGWRMESKRYPLLTEKASARMTVDWDEFWGGDRRFVDSSTPNSYGGFYTQEQIRKLVDYAAKKYITIIPEIELPGHSNEVFAAYPELNCKGAWDYNISEYCMGKEETFKFLFDILDETMQLFPSKYIHIGGDEADKTAWGNCPLCKKRMQEEGLNSLEELQSYCIRRVEKYLNSKGRQIIGWDEILEGGLAPNATVMSWRGEGGGKTAARAGHSVIMTPGRPLYIDSYQAQPDNEPKSNGGYNTLEMVYAYNPLPADLTPEEQKHILGAQANLWAEYVMDEDHASYMYFPRVFALAEINWTELNNKDWPDFLRRANLHNKAVAKRGLKVYPLRNLELDFKVDPQADLIRVNVKKENLNAQIHYTLDGTAPTFSSPVYKDEIVVKDSADLCLRLFEDGQSIMDKAMCRRVDNHLAINCPVTYHCQIHRSYPAGGESALVDGIRGSHTYLDKRWQGFTETLNCVIDLGAARPLSYVSMRFLQDRPSWVYMPGEVEVLLSADGKEFQSIGILKPHTPDTINGLHYEIFRFDCQETARYVKVRAEQSHGKGQFLFVDEVIVW